MGILRLSAPCCLRGGARQTYGPRRKHSLSQPLLMRSQQISGKMQLGVVCVYLRLSVLGWSQPTALRLLTALVGGFHKPEFALKSNTFAFIFFCLANGERNMGGLYLNEMCCSSNSEKPEEKLLMEFKQVLFCLKQQIFRCPLNTKPPPGSMPEALIWGDS